MTTLTTPWSQSFGLTAPVVNAPMGGVSGRMLVAAVETRASENLVAASMAQNCQGVTLGDMLDPAARTGHWDGRYRSVGAGSLSWFESEPLQSVKLIDLVGANHQSSIIDVGGGVSNFARRLLVTGYEDVTVLDISEEALAIAKANADRSDHATWIQADLLQWTPLRKWDVWHDRAVFHFLTEPAERATYRNLLHSAVVDGGAVVIATFAENGPTSCSGLPVERYSPEHLIDEIGAGLSTIDSGGIEHITPTGSTQEFTWVALRAAAPLTVPG